MMVIKVHNLNSRGELPNERLEPCSFCGFPTIYKITEKNSLIWIGVCPLCMNYNIIGEKSLVFDYRKKHNEREIAKKIQSWVENGEYPDYEIKREMLIVNDLHLAISKNEFINAFEEFWSDDQIKVIFKDKEKDKWVGKFIFEDMEIKFEINFFESPYTVLSIENNVLFKGKKIKTKKSKEFKTNLYNLIKLMILKSSKKEGLNLVISGFDIKDYSGDNKEIEKELEEKHKIFLKVLAKQVDEILEDMSTFNPEFEKLFKRFIKKALKIKLRKNVKREDLIGQINDCKHKLYLVNYHFQNIFEKKKQMQEVVKKINIKNKEFTIGYISLDYEAELEAFLFQSRAYLDFLFNSVSYFYEGTPVKGLKEVKNITKKHNPKIFEIIKENEEWIKEFKKARDLISHYHSLLYSPQIIRLDDNLSIETAYMKDLSLSENIKKEGIEEYTKKIKNNLISLTEKIYSELLS